MERRELRPFQDLRHEHVSDLRVPPRSDQGGQQGVPEQQRDGDLWSGQLQLHNNDNDNKDNDNNDNDNDNNDNDNNDLYIMGAVCLCVCYVFSYFNYFGR